MKHNFQLLDGHFTPTEAGDVLLSLVKNNINFFKVQCLSFHESLAGDVALPINQIEELKNVDASLRTLLKQASDQGLQLKINGFIEISHA